MSPQVAFVGITCCFHTVFAAVLPMFPVVCVHLRVDPPDISRE